MPMMEASKTIKDKHEVVSGSVIKLPEEIQGKLMG